MLSILNSFPVKVDSIYSTIGEEQIHHEIKLVNNLIKDSIFCYSDDTIIAVDITSDSSIISWNNSVSILIGRLWIGISVDKNDVTNNIISIWSHPIPYDTRIKFIINSTYCECIIYNLSKCLVPDGDIDFSTHMKSNIIKNEIISIELLEIFKEKIQKLEKVEDHYSTISKIISNFDNMNNHKYIDRINFFIPQSIQRVLCLPSVII